MVAEEAAFGKDDRSSEGGWGVHGSPLRPWGQTSALCFGGPASVPAVASLRIVQGLDHLRQVNGLRCEQLLAADSMSPLALSRGQSFADDTAAAFGEANQYVMICSHIIDLIGHPMYIGYRYVACSGIEDEKNVMSSVWCDDDALCVSTIGNLLYSRRYCAVGCLILSCGRRYRPRRRGGGQSRFHQKIGLGERFNDRCDKLFSYLAGRNPYQENQRGQFFSLRPRILAVTLLDEADRILDAPAAVPPRDGCNILYNKECLPASPFAWP